MTRAALISATLLILATIGMVGARYRSLRMSPR
jgi:hypothetical protein